MESESKRIPLSKRSKRALTKIANGESVPARTLAYLERLGLVQLDLLVEKPMLTQDGREHLWG